MLTGKLNLKPNKQNIKMTTIDLLLISGFGRKDVVEHLLECGANVHARDDGGLIPLHNACSFGHAEVVQLLLRHGADPNARDNWNYTPLHEAAIKGKIDVCIGKYISINSNCSKISITFSNKMWVIKIVIHKLLGRIANREDPDQTASSEAV